MLHNIIIFFIGFVLWKVIPGKFTAGSKKVRSYIDMGSQILGIVLMLIGIIHLIKFIFS